ncbi:YceD family protein [Cytobacillus sp. S13-E01]|uniref:YceD family protein n=1 Tax=Cytobacillus sp. S13-E01 TaxID=3031326 RepID=UPI0023D7E352|nr:YceD family protein [Cytobacillus sp. S13-E01]MDF0725298.1 YceD family protein [Cytobacillus sp. S13-E01]
MEWSITQLHQLQNKGLSIDKVVDASDLIGLNTIRDISPVKVSGHADLSSKKVSFHITISGTLILPCSRTLVDVHYPFEIVTTETFLLSQTSEFETDEDAHYVHGEMIDLYPIIRELILLEIPLQVFSDDDNVRGGAPQAGRDWEVITEEDKSNQIDPRLAGLSKFFENDKKD